MRGYFRDHIRAGISPARFNERWSAPNLELVAKPRQLANVTLLQTLELATGRLGQTNARKFENQAKKALI